MKRLLWVTMLSAALTMPLVTLATVRADSPAVMVRDAPDFPGGRVRATPTPAPAPIWLKDRDAPSVVSALLRDLSVRIVSPGAGQVHPAHDPLSLHVVRSSQWAADFDQVPPRFDLQWEHRYEGEAWRAGGVPVTLLDEVQHPGGMSLPGEIFRRAPSWRLRARLAGVPGAQWTEWQAFEVRPYGRNEP